MSKFFSFFSKKKTPSSITALNKINVNTTLNKIKYLENLNSETLNLENQKKIQSMLITQDFSTNVYPKSQEITDAEITSVLNSSSATFENNPYPGVIIPQSTTNTIGTNGQWFVNSNGNSFAQGTAISTTNYNNSTYGFPQLIDVLNKKNANFPLVDIETLKNKLKKISTENAEVLLNEINKMSLELDSLKKKALEEMADIKNKEESEKDCAAITQLEL
jgi:hypothetical protein